MIDERLKSLIQQSQRLANEAVRLYSPTVSDVCLRFAKGEEVGEAEVARLLDGLLGFCFDSRIVELYRKVCKAAVPFYQQLIVDYIGYYKEQWDNGEE